MSKSKFDNREKNCKLFSLWVACVFPKPQLYHFLPRTRPHHAEEIWTHGYCHPSFSKIVVFKCFPSTLKRKAGIFKFLRFEKRFRKASFSCRISVDGRPNRRNNAAFSNFLSVAWTRPSKLPLYLVRSFFHVKGQARDVWKHCPKYGTLIHEYSNWTLSCKSFLFTLFSSLDLLYDKFLRLAAAARWTSSNSWSSNRTKIGIPPSSLSKQNTTIYTWASKLIHYHDITFTTVS